jgi:hypothetical protein
MNIKIRLGSDDSFALNVNNGRLCVSDVDYFLGNLTALFRLRRSESIE